MNEITDINIHISTKEDEMKINNAIFIRIKEGDGKDGLERLEMALNALKKVIQTYQVK